MNNSTQFFVSGNSAPFQYDSKAVTPNTFAYRCNTDVKGQGQVIMTNGSNIVSGISTNFLDSTTGLGLSYWFNFWVKDSANNWYRVNALSFQSNTRLTIASVVSRNLIRLGGNNGSGNFNVPTIPSTFTGVSGTYNYYVGSVNWSDGLYSVAMGNSSYAENFGIALGGSSAALGGIAAGFQAFSNLTGNIALGTQTRAIGNSGGAVALGYRTEASGTFGAFAFGVATIASNKGAVAGGTGSDPAGTASDRFIISSGIGSIHISTATVSQTATHGALADGSVILGGQDHNIPSNSNRSVILGGNLIKAPSATTDTVFMPKLRIGLGTGGSLTSGSTSNDFLVRATGGDVVVRRMNRVISGATNGVTVLSSNKVQLGGQLTGSTQIGLTANILTFTASTGSIKYGGNYSANFTARSLVDKGFVTGLTTTSAINQVVYGSANGQLSSTSNLLWSGSTNMFLNANFKLNTAGNGLYVKEGTNATSGVKTLTGGTAIVSTTKVTASSRIQLTSQVDGGTPGFVRVSTRSAGTSFTILSSSGSDTSVIGWFIVEPA